MRGTELYDARVEYEAIQASKRDRDTPEMKLAYPRHGVWSGQNQLGVELPFQLDAHNEQTIFKMDEWGFPEVWTISLSVRTPDSVEQGTVTLGKNQAFDIIGEVSFGSGGVMQTFQLDWVEGTMFSLPMNAINIRAKWSLLATLFGIAPPDDVRVSAIISRGALRHARATKTDVFDQTVAAGKFLSTVLNPIPAFAKSVILVSGFTGTPSDLYNANTLFQFYANSSDPANPGNVLIASIPGNFLTPTVSGAVPIPVNARYWSLKNGGNAPIHVAANVVWNLFDE